MKSKDAGQAEGPPETAGGRKSGRVQSIDRAVAILRCFDSRAPEISLSEIARRTELSTSTVHRLLVSMVENDLVRQSSDRRYRLGPLVIRLGNSGGVATTLREAALPIARAARDEADETVGIHELLAATGQRVVVDQVESHQALRRTYTEFGEPIDVVHGAPGKAMLAFLPADQRERWLGQGIEQKTPTTVADPDRLREQLTEVRARGWAYSDGERTPGIRSVAAPVFDHTGSVVGAIGYSVPTIRMDDDRVPVLGEQSRVAAERVSAALGATPEGIEAARLLAEGP